MKVLLIDNTDSFTWNLAQQIESLGAHCQVVPNTVSLRAVKKFRPDRIVLSPGPGGPGDAGVCLEILKAIPELCPILGVCLGHQCMAHVFGGPSFVGRAPAPVHGKTANIRHTNTSIFRGMPQPFTAARYHSLIVKKLPKNFELLAWVGAEKLIMGMRHAELPLIGVQFHPESFLTQHGDRLMKNFLTSRW